MRTVILTFFFVMMAVSLDAAWFRGNTHTHTLESDGDSSPADVACWYRDHGYQFLVITDHDKITRLDIGPELLLIPGEEVTDRLPKKPLHLNAIGLREVVPPQSGDTPLEVLQRNVDAIRAAGGLAAINHPNFGWAFGADELRQLEGATFLEIASGHPYVNMDGPPAVEEMWDAVLTSGKTIWGIAVDDSHHLKRPFDTDVALPGKAWIVVRADVLTQPAILSAMQRGDFYASTGVELTDIAIDTASMTVAIREKNFAHYRTQFIGAGGRVLKETRDNPARYDVRGDEGYVRARVVDSNGRKAWIQPMRIQPMPTMKR